MTTIKRTRRSSQSEKAAYKASDLKARYDYAKKHPRRTSKKANAKAKAANVNASKRHALNAYPKRPRSSSYSQLIRKSAGASERGDT